jgi:shikimate kinase
MTGGKAFSGAVLIGFMGAGKSSVGKRLANRLGAGFVDLDERIEGAAGMAVGEIFASRGEAAFREMERRAVREAVSVPGRVVSAGGGAFVDTENRRLLKGYAPVFLLEVSPETVLARLSGDAARPLLAGPDREHRIRELLRERAPSYAEADHAVRTDGRTVEQVADEIMALLERREKEGKR